MPGNSSELLQLSHQGRELSVMLHRRAKRKKSIGFRVQRDGTVEVLAPHHLSQKAIMMHVMLKWDWLTAKADDFAAHTVKPKDDELFVLGRSQQLIVEQDSQHRWLEHFPERDEIHLWIKRGDIAQGLWEPWFREQAKRYFQQRLELISEAMPWVNSPPLLKTRKMKTRWGSCTGKGNINLNLYLYHAPPQCIDEVICHELCHLKEMNHSPRFYALMDEHLPDWRLRNQQLVDFARRHIHYQ